ncbi:MAG: ester cyclase [Anaerolineae bacterium]|nr:ester cyclase [Anaerolineae bacterium]
MSTEQNKALVRKFEELINSRDLDTALTLLSPDFADHTPAVGLPPGIEGVRAFFTMQFAAFPDSHSISLDIIAEGDKVVHRMSNEGTHQDEFLGIPATGKRVAMTHIDIWRIADGKLAEHWVEADMMGMMQQLGVVS